MSGLNNWSDDNSGFGYTSDDLHIEQEDLPDDLRRKRGYFLLGALLLNVVVWLFSYLFKDYFWFITVQMIEHRPDMPKIFDWYFMFFTLSYRYLTWFTSAIAFMFIFKKAVALKIICIYALTYLIAWYLILSIKAKRVAFEDIPNNKMNCTCVFGMPSCQSSEVTITILLFFYELAIKPSLFKRKTKFFMKVLCFFLICNISLAKIYFGSHTVEQTVAGLCLALLIFTISLYFEDYLTNYFSNFLHANFYYAAPLYIIFMVITTVNVIVLPLIMEHTIEKFSKFSSKRCYSACFSNNLLGIRKNITAALQYNTLVLGILIGSRLLKPGIQPSSENFALFKRHMSFKGLMRILIMCVMHVPLFIVRQPITQNAHMAGFLLIYTLVYISVGFNVSFGFTMACRKLGLDLEGDLERKRAATLITSAYTDDTSKDTWYSKAK